VLAERGGASGVRYLVQKAILSQEDIAMESGGQLQGGEKGGKLWRELERREDKEE
jgi:hypothetical protein